MRELMATEAVTADDRQCWIFSNHSNSLHTHTHRPAHCQLFWSAEAKTGRVGKTLCSKGVPLHKHAICHRRVPHRGLSRPLACPTHTGN